jgi:hypothetical protein
MDRGKFTFVEEVFTAEEVAASGSALTRVIDVGQSGGQFSVQVELTGDGTATIDWVGSNDGTDYIKPNGASDIVAGFIKTSGPGSDGKHIYSFNVIPIKFIKLKITETGGVNSVTLTATIAIQ